MNPNSFDCENSKFAADGHFIEWLNASLPEDSTMKHMNTILLSRRYTCTVPVTNTSDKGRLSDKREIDC